jgi:CubicO group peptidase (beta-lactamase class C family)
MRRSSTVATVEIRLPHHCNPRIDMATSPKNKWLSAALDYIPSWIELQLRASQQPGCVVAIAFKDKVLLDEAFGVADLSTGEKLTPRHRFRVASHSKSFTAAGVMKLRERGKLKLDDPIGDYVAKLNSRERRLGKFSRITPALPETVATAASLTAVAHI